MNNLTNPQDLDALLKRIATSGSYDAARYSRELANTLSRPLAPEPEEAPLLVTVPEELSKPMILAQDEIDDLLQRNSPAEKKSANHPSQEIQGGP